MGLRDHLHHDKTTTTADHPNNVQHVGGVAPEQVHMPGMAAGYTKPVYVPVESLPKNTQSPPVVPPRLLRSPRMFLWVCLCLVRMESMAATMICCPRRVWWE